MHVSRMLLLLSVAVGTSSAQPTILGVTNGASYSGNLAPGTWASIFGTQLASDMATAQSVPLPPQLDNVSVTIGGITAPMRFVSPSQINVVIPF